MAAPRTLLRTATVSLSLARPSLVVRTTAVAGLSRSARPSPLPTCGSVLPRTLSSSSFHRRLLSSSAPRSDRHNPVASDKRWTNAEKVTYEELKPLTESPSDKVLLIDVREPAEVALGSIPSSVNLPLSSFEKSLAMDEGDFTRVHGFHKPTKKQPMIFYCKAGVRAQTAVDLARSQGYKLSRNYEGSYNDWVQREGNNQDD